jgi:hypothetical protein
MVEMDVLQCKRGKTVRFVCAGYILLHLLHNSVCQMVQDMV